MEPSHSNTGQSRSVDRKTVEKNRRMQMKSLYSELISLLPHHSSTVSSSWPSYMLI